MSVSCFLLVSVLVQGVLGHPFQDPSDNSNGTIHDLIYGGQPAQEGQFPWQVYIDLGDTACGGSIINPKTIATAAHCHFDHQGNRIPANQVTVYAGSTRRRGGDRIPAAQTWVHSDYNPSQDGGKNDVAVVQLERALIYNDNIQEIQMMPENTADYNSGKCYLSGFGSTTTHSAPVSDILLWTTVNLRPDRDCHWDTGHYDDATMVCAGGDEGSNLCAGDSGGPLACYMNNQFYLYGVVSRGPLDCSRAVPGSYSSVSYWNPWYQKFMAW